MIYSKPIKLNDKNINQKPCNIKNKLNDSKENLSDNELYEYIIKLNSNQSMIIFIINNVYRYGINESPTDIKLLNRQQKLKDIVNKSIIKSVWLNFKAKRDFHSKSNRRYLLNLPKDDEIPVKFESRFENGNLKKAVKISDTEYNLILNFDYNTDGHTQWYYFKIFSKLKAGKFYFSFVGTKIKFNILNLMKPDSLYNYGMKPWVKSESHQKETGTGWHRDWTDISYSINNILKKRTKVPPEGLKSNARLAQYYFFTLSFTYTLLYDDDEVSFAHAEPYTYYGHLLPFVSSIAKEEKYHEYLRVGTLWKTLARNNWKMLIITENIKTYRNLNDELKWYTFLFTI